MARVLRLGVADAERHSWPLLNVSDAARGANLGKPLQAHQESSGSPCGDDRRRILTFIDYYLPGYKAGGRIDGCAHRGKTKGSKY